MNKKDSLAILGVLLIGSSDTFCISNNNKSLNKTANRVLLDNILNYLRKVKLPFETVRDLLNNDYGSVFYHYKIGRNSYRLPKKYDKEKLYTSEHDNQIWITKKGKVGIWCEVDGFVAWLDEYKKVWIIDSREEVERRRKEFDARMQKYFGEFSKIFDKEMKTPENEHDVKVVPLTIVGLADYKKGK